MEDDLPHLLIRITKLEGTYDATAGLGELSAHAGFDIFRPAINFFEARDYQGERVNPPYRSSN